MTSALLMAALLGGDPEAASVRQDANAAETAPADPSVPLERDAAREWYRDLAARTTRRAGTDASEAVPQLVTMYVMVDEVEGLSLQEKQRMKVTLRGRMAWYQHRLRREVVQAKREARRRDGNAGGSSVVASSLIDLIQTTINPPIWDVNGGPAGIGYFAPLHALVVRAPGEVHYQLRDVLGQLRKIQANQPQVVVGGALQAVGNQQAP